MMYPLEVLWFELLHWLASPMGDHGALVFFCTCRGALSGFHLQVISREIMGNERKLKVLTSFDR